ncbi:MAG: S8/S53 family peptidase [Gluconacetobacter diazotrophicus]|nr:S8/S53 family peptidase [Gluconacetobacter diazotrophicus]
MPKSSSKRVALAGTEKRPMAGARVLGPVDPQQRLGVSVLVRSRRPLDGRRAPLRPFLASAPAAREYLTREELAVRHGADPADLDRVEAFAHEHGLTVAHRSAGERRVVLAGTLEALTKAFGVRLQRVSFQGREHRMRTGPVRVPASLAGIVEDVKGFDDRPQANPHFRRLGARAAATAYTPLQVARFYDFPAGADGSGECIALIELGGGYQTADLQTYFQGLGLPAPSVVAVGVDGGTNTPGGDADGEVMLDIEVAGAVAPQARIAVYFAPNTDQGFVDAIKTAVHDTVRKPSVVSISWGGPEESYTAQGLKNYDAVFQEAAALGVTILVASGDNGSADTNPPDKKKRVDFPSASPLVLACGGTRLEASGTAIQAETVWNDGAQGGASGGGVSTKYPLPVWQKAAKVPKLGTKTGRGVPDVAGDADPQTGYRVRVDGRDQVIGGTSAVAPLWAGLLALCNQRLGKPVGFLNAMLYTDAAARASLRDVTTGNNGAYKAAVGWDACTGLGSPEGTALLTALGGRGPKTGQRKPTTRAHAAR